MRTPGLQNYAYHMSRLHGLHKVTDDKLEMYVKMLLRKEHSQLAKGRLWGCNTFSTLNMRVQMRLCTWIWRPHMSPTTLWLSRELWTSSRLKRLVCPLKHSRHGVTVHGSTDYIAQSCKASCQMRSWQQTHCRFWTSQHWERKL